MATLQTPARSAPTQSFDQMRRLMDRMMGWPSAGFSTDIYNDNLALDVYDKGNDLIVKAALPGVKPDDLSVTYLDGLLTIKGQVAEEMDVNEDNYRLREYQTTWYSRSVRLPHDVDGDHIKATFDDGMLRLTIPKKMSKAPKKIAVSSK